MKQRIYTRDGLMTFDQATMDSTGAFLIGELERLDQTLHQPLAAVTWHRDIDPRMDVTIGDELSSFTNSSFGAPGGNSPGGKSWIAKETNAIPGIALDIGKTASPLNLWGMDLSYTIPELVSAMQLGRPIDAQKLAAINLKWNMDIDNQVYLGDTDLGVYGLCNNPGVAFSNVVNGASASPLWSSKTAQEILNDIRSLEVAAWTASGFSVAPKQILVPSPKYVYLLQPMTITVGTGGVSPGGSIADYIAKNSLCMEQNGTPLEIHPVKWLTGAGASATDRMVAYTREYDRVRFPMTSLLSTPLDTFGLFKKTTYYSRVGVTEVVYPETVAYRDGI